MDRKRILKVWCVYRHVLQSQQYVLVLFVYYYMLIWIVMQ